MGGVAFLNTLCGEVTSRPRPGWPTTDYKTVDRKLEEATLVVITYFDGSKVIVGDGKWIEELKHLLAEAGGKPTSYCFCISYPTVTFLTKDGPIATMELPHGNKLRFHGDFFSGDFEIDPKIAMAIAALAVGQRANAMPLTKKAPVKLDPPRIEINRP
jgi:hypothetical protein